MKTVWEKTEHETLMRIKDSFTDKADPGLHKQYWHRFKMLDLNATLTSTQVRNQIMDTIYKMLADELNDENNT